MQNTAEILEFPNENLVSHLGIEIDLSKDERIAFDTSLETVKELFNSATQIDKSLGS